VPIQPTPYKAQLVALLARVRDANPTAEILWLRTWMPNYHVNTRMALWLMHEWVTADAVEAVDGKFVDMTGWPSYCRSALDNRWHYNDLGHQKITDTLLEHL
jgi:hypothetical protein